MLLHGVSWPILQSMQSSHNNIQFLCLAIFMKHDTREHITKAKEHITKCDNNKMEVNHEIRLRSQSRHTRHLYRHALGDAILQVSESLPPISLLIPIFYKIHHAVIIKSRWFSAAFALWMRQHHAPSGEIHWLDVVLQVIAIKLSPI